MAGEDAAQQQTEKPVLIVTGLKQEARIAAGPGLTVICSSSNPVQLREMMMSFDPASISGIVSFGVAGGLSPKLRSGDIVIASEIVAAKGRWVAAEGLSQALYGLPEGEHRIMRGVLVGVEEVVLGRKAKAALRSATGADAVDMESHIAARYAEQYGLPFAALRVISDPAHRALPEIAAAALKANGDVDVWKVMRGIARRPSQIRALVHSGRDFNRALRGLRSYRSRLDGASGFRLAEAAE
ncbi:phosphorylase [Afipia felis]|uniref:Hopanoid-associated phosphorylase n=2 Tax=Afipia felis TaxID=1035 RepID=A0A380W9E6_AFIFE|nr:phosphorylase [Afipia felis]EKS28768.1 hopanoid-associated phosphorylase [Afipia felis ATCC 53690]SUU77476.1 hopanoid-associated phosphorylase [Afipia felis]SUU85542.1 hopanoid-associated phosphorylase [Afipia felis]